MCARNPVPSARWMAVFLLVAAAVVGRAEEKESAFLVGFFGQYPFGQVNTAVISPDDSYANFNPIEFGYGFGLSIEYRLAPSLRLFLDGSHSSYRKQVGVAGANSSRERPSVEKPPSGMVVSACASASKGRISSSSPESPIPSSRRKRTSVRPM